MSYMKELAFRLREEIEGRGNVGDLSDIAETLGGEVDGRTVRIPSPGCPADDRSCYVRIDPTRPASFFIYDCEGPKRAAYVAVREKLRLIAPPVAPSAARSEVARRLWGESIPATGTIVERYLHSRAINLKLPLTLRFHPSLQHTPTGGTWPAMIALVTSASDAPVAIHRRFAEEL